MIIQSKLKGIAYYILVSAPRHLRMVLGPLPSPICRIETFFLIFLTNNMAMLWFAITGTRFVLIRVYKSMPVMNDSLLAFIIYSNILMISFLFTFSKFLMEELPDMQEVEDNFLRLTIT